MFGRSYYLNLPGHVVEVMGWEKGERMRMYREGSRLIIEEEKPVWPVVKPK
jgi:hypothetical protein